MVSALRGGGAPAVSPEWQAAAGRLAAVTPMLVVGTDSHQEADLVERLKVGPPPPPPPFLPSVTQFRI
jgi:hypothetical protein